MAKEDRMTAKWPVDGVKPHCHAPTQQPNRKRVKHSRWFSNSETPTKRDCSDDKDQSWYVMLALALEVSEFEKQASEAFPQHVIAETVRI